MKMECDEYHFITSNNKNKTDISVLFLSVQFFFLLKKPLFITQTHLPLFITIIFKETIFLDFKTITYTIFDCSTQSYSTKTVDIKEKVLLVGVYSYHQKVRKYIDKLCYLIVNESEQLNRLKQRKMFDRFINEWVPLENKYYNSFDFIGEANILI